MERGAPGVKHFLTSMSSFVGSAPFKQAGNSVFEAHNIRLLPWDSRSGRVSPTSSRTSRITGYEGVRTTFTNACGCCTCHRGNPITFILVPIEYAWHSSQLKAIVHSGPWIDSGVSCTIHEWSPGLCVYALS